jgi:hypothetical protein
MKGTCGKIFMWFTSLSQISIFLTNLTFYSFNILIKNTDTLGIIGFLNQVI